MPTKKDEQQALADILKNPSQGGAAIPTNALGAGADVPSVLEQNPATRQLLQEAIYTRTGQQDKAVASSAAYNNQTSTQATPSSATSLITPATSTSETSTQTVSGNEAGSYALPSIYDLVDIPQKSESEIYQEKLDRMQSQIDAINSYYNSLIQQAQKEGEGRLGSARALQSVSGTRFSPRGEAQTQAVENYNSQVIAGIQAQKNAAIQALYNEAASAAQEQANTLTEQALTAANSYIDSLAKQYSLNLEEKQLLAEEAYKRAALTGEYGGNPTLAMLDYLQSVEQQAFENQLAEKQLEQKQGYLDIAQKQLERGNYEFVSLPDGRYGYYDLTSGTPVFVEVGRKPVYSGYSSGSSNSVSPYGTSVYDSVVADLYNGKYTIDELRDLYSASQLNAIADRYNELVSAGTFAGVNKY